MLEKLDSSQLEQGVCLVCGRSDGKLERALTDTFNLRRCEHCTIGYLDPRLTESSILALYSSDAYFFDPGSEGYGVSYDVERRSLFKTAQGIVARLRQLGAQGRLLEVGCGTGVFLEAARGVFSYAVGTDYSEAAAAKARAYADRVVRGGIDDVADEAPFDVVVINQVIEHIYAPAAFVEKLKARLRPGGLLVVTTPFFDSFWYTLLGRRWPSFKLPEHVSFFNPAGLRALVDGSGLEIAYLGPHPHYFSLASILSKVGVSRAGSLAEFPIHLPRTSLMLIVRK